MAKSIQPGSRLLLYLLGVLTIISIQEWSVLIIIGSGFLLINTILRRLKKVWQGIGLASPFLITGGIIGFFNQQGGLVFAGFLVSKLVCIVVYNSYVLYNMRENDLVVGMNQIKVPMILSTTMFFILRYRQVLKDEMGRLRLAREIRGGRFKASFNVKNYTALAQVMGAGLIRSLDRGDRVFRAMWLRGLKANSLFASNGSIFDDRIILFFGILWMILVIIIDRSGLIWF